MNDGRKDAVDFSIRNADWHLHSNYSDGQNDIEFVVRAAKFHELEAIAITDHLKGEKFLNGKTIRSYFKQIDNAASKYPGIKVYKGVEGTLLDTEGALSISSREIGLFHPVLIDFAWGLKGVSTDAPPRKIRLLKNISKSFANLCKNDAVDIIAHPFNFGRLIKGFDLSWLSDDFLEEIAGCFAGGKKYFEIMNEIWWWFPETPVDEFNADYLRILKIFNSRGVKFSIGSDAHDHQGIGNLDYSKMMLARMRGGNGKRR